MLFKKAHGDVRARTFAEIYKADRPMQEGMVYGFASVIAKDGQVITDTQGDQIETAELERAAADFMLNSRTGGHNHLRDAEGYPIKAGEIVSSVVFTPELQKALGISVPVSWLIGLKVTDP